MENEYPEHFSCSYKVDLDNLPSKNTDKISLSILLPGIVLGILLIMIGIYEFLGWFNSSNTVFDGLATTYHHDTILTPMIFDAVLVILGLGVVLSLLFKYVRYKKIFFDGSTFIITYRPIFGEKKIVSEELVNYEGIRFRTEFFQFGLLNRNKYIVELCHDDENKTIPLYISMKDKNINSIMKHFANALNKPIIVVRGGDYVYRTVEEFSESIVNMPEDTDGYYLELEDYKPQMLTVKEKDDKIIIKVKRIIWDAYNVLALFISIFLISMLALQIKNWNDVSLVTVFLASVISLGIFVSLACLLKKDKIIIKKDKVIVHHKLIGLSRKHREVYKKDVKSIEVTTNPATGRSFITIASEDVIMVFGKKIPLDDLIWVRVFLISNLLNKL